LKGNRSHIAAANPVFILVIGCFCLLFGASVSPASSPVTEESYEEAVIREAKKGDSQSQFALALIYEYGTDTITRNPDQSLVWLDKASKGDVAAACLYLGMKYEYGNRVKQDIKKAACLYRCAACKGWAPAQFFLAGLYENGKGIRRSSISALAWLGLAAENDYPGAAEKFSRLIAKARPNYLAKVRKKQKKLMGQVGTPCI